jgi:MFS family permease
MPGESGRVSAYTWYVVAILTLANVSSYADRQILTLLVGPIRRDLVISDTQMSLLLGVSFAVFYTVLGFPIARLADRRSRRSIIAAGIAVWSVMTALCGIARNYTQLLLARIGVGVGEAALSPPAYSMIADYFPREKLGTAIGAYSMGIYVGVGLAQIIGGAVVAVVGVEAAWSLPFVGEVRPWQVVFFAVGLPGLLIATLMATVREPARRGGPDAPAMPVAEIVSFFRTHMRTFRAHHLGVALIALCNYGMGSWLPTFFVRTYGWSVSQAGYLLGVANLTFGIAGVLLAGRLADRMQQRGVTDAKLRVCLYAGLGLLVCDVATPLMPTGLAAAVWIFPLSFFASAPFGVAAAAVQELVPDRMRAQASALYLFVVSIIGLTLGPTVVALATDYLFRDDAALRYSLALVTGVGLVMAAIILTRGLAPYRATLAAMTSSPRSPFPPR